MGSLRRRAARLEERRGSRRREVSEEERYTDWLQRQRIRRRDATPKCAFHATSMIAWLAMIGEMPGSAEALIERIIAEPHDVSGHMQPPETRSVSVTGWEAMRAIWRGDEGTEAIELPAAWREAVEAGEILRGVISAAPPEMLARWVIEAVEASEERGADTDEEIDRRTRRYLEERGIDPALLDQAAGPDRDEIPPEERRWRLSELGAEDMDGPMGWEIRQAVNRLANERDDTKGGK